MINYLYVAIKTDPDNNQWEYQRLSSNLAIPFSLIAELSHKDWDWNDVSKRPDVDIEFVVSHPNKKWNMCILSANCAVDAIVNNYRSNQQLEWHWHSVSNQYKNCTNFLEIVQSNPDLPWIYKHVTLNAKLCDILKYVNIPWDWQWHNYNNTFLNMRIDIVLNNSQVKWNWKFISRFIVFTEEEFENNIDLPWDTYYLSNNPCLTMKLYMKYRTHKNWIWSENALYLCMCVTIDELYTYKDNSDINLNWGRLSKNKQISSAQIVENLKSANPLPWIYSELGIRYDISNELIAMIGEEHSEQIWQKTQCYPEIPISTILSHSDQIIHWNTYVDNFTWDGIVALKNKDWHFMYLSKSKKGLNINHLQQLHDKNINWNYISKNKKIVSINDILANPTLPWTQAVIFRDDITAEQIKLINAKFNPLLNENIHTRQKLNLTHEKWSESQTATFTRYNRNRRAAHIDMICKKWRFITIQHRNSKRDIFDPVLDMLRLRIRDHDLSLRDSLTSSKVLST